MIADTLERTKTPAKSNSEDYGVLVGWTHTPFTKGIDLCVQSTAKSSLRDHGVDSRHFLMTRNQALILAKYLLDVTGQTLPEPPRAGRLRTLGRRLLGG
ncbi:hypothetical protein [Novosphingobium lentum]|uniref:hypothetical protein n=1 Tax=Novosphingobium lentum TaxID=145287 RepID=UPI000ACB5E45|nr:hypothetical protein [Novosphingobium lentum]